MPTSLDRKKYVKRTCIGELHHVKGQGGFQGEQLTFHLISRREKRIGINLSLGHKIMNRGTQRQFSENTCSVDDLRSRIFGTFVAKFLEISCLPASPGIFEHLKKGIIAHC